MKKKVVLGMSGGVDSTAAALLLREQEYEVVGATLRLQTEEVEAAGNAARDLADAQAVCAQLGIDHTVLDWRKAFRERVLDTFAQAYQEGQTPNPCVVCNPNVKFPALVELADQLGANYIATGHYARVAYDQEMERYRLMRSQNHKKDQSYALYRLGQGILSRVLFPLGAYDKERIRDIVGQAGISIAAKGDSQDICFVPDGDYAAFLERHTGNPPMPGRFVDEAGTVLGQHRGLWHYTVGQRKGLGISFGEPRFVKQIDPCTGDIMLSGNMSLFSKGLIAGDVSWIDFECLERPIPLQAKIRYSHRPCQALVSPESGGRISVTFEEPQRAVTPGQSVVLYNGEYVVGGGIIIGPVS